LDTGRARAGGHGLREGHGLRNPAEGGPRAEKPGWEEGSGPYPGWREREAGHTRAGEKEGYPGYIPGYTVSGVLWIAWPPSPGPGIPALGTPLLPTGLRTPSAVHAGHPATALTRHLAELSVSGTATYRNDSGDIP